MRKMYLLASTMIVVGSSVVGSTAAIGADDPGLTADGWTTIQATRGGVSVESASKGTTTIEAYKGASVLAPDMAADNTLFGVSLPAVPEVPKAAVLPTVYEMSLASGMTPAEACKYAKGMDPYGCEVSSKLSYDAAKAGKFIDSWCYDLVSYKGDGSKHAHACISRYLDASNATYKWIANKMKVTGWTEDPGWVHDRINGVGVQVRYKASDSFATDWSPYTTTTIKDSCKSTTTSVTGKSGVGYSTTDTVCPDKLTGWHSPEYQYFGAKWTGDAAPSSDERGAIATSVHKIPKSQGTYAEVWAWIHWN